MTNKVAVFDIETLGIRAKSVVLSLGIVIADLDEVNSIQELINDGVYIEFDVFDQFRMGRTACESTLDWWKEQNEFARQVLMLSKNEIPIEDFWNHIPQDKIDEMTTKLQWYCRGSHFDAAILGDLLEDYGVEVPWKYSNVRDSRTALELLRYDYEFNDPSDSSNYHFALYDAALEAHRLQIASCKKGVL